MRAAEVTRGGHLFFGKSPLMEHDPRFHPAPHTHTHHTTTATPLTTSHCLTPPSLMHTNSYSLLHTLTAVGTHTSPLPPRTKSHRHSPGQRIRTARHRLIQSLPSAGPDRLTAYRWVNQNQRLRSISDAPSGISKSPSRNSSPPSFPPTAPRHSITAFVLLKP